MLLPTLEAPPRRDAVRIGEVKLTYSQLADRARAHARCLHAAGVSPGDRVALWALPSADTVVALVGNLLAGVASVPLNPSVGDAELNHVLRDASPRALVGDVPPDRAARVGSLPVIRVTRDHTRAITPVSFTVGPDDVALVLYTSGTTGAPKGAVLTHGNVAANLDALARAWAWTADDVLVHALPLFHVHGLALGLLGPLRVGSTVRVLPRFDPAALAAALGREGTMLFGVPTMYHRLAELAERDRAAAAALARARLLVSGSAGLPLREHARIAHATGRGVLERYGLTETLINTAVRAAEGPSPGSVGPALDGVELRLVDDARAPMDVWDGATLGEVAVRGPNVFAGYLNRPDATAAVRDAEGWFYTGDLATRDTLGALRIVGRRATDLIKTGGYKVGAGEVEGCLLEHPAVREAAVVGVADEDLGERIVAFVALAPGAEATAAALAEHVTARLAPHKRPRRVVFVDALPRNAMGKVLKAALRKDS